MAKQSEIKRHKVLHVYPIGDTKQIVIVENMLSVCARTKSDIYLAYYREKKYHCGICFLPYWTNEIFIDSDAALFRLRARVKDKVYNRRKPLKL